jgi:hypothetical protein
MLISGMPIIDSKQLEQLISYGGYCRNDSVIEWFW